MDEDSESGRGKEFLEVSVPPRARKRETAFAASRSIPPYPTSHSSQVARVINTLAFGKGHISPRQMLSGSGPGAFPQFFWPFLQRISAQQTFSVRVGRE